MELLELVLENPSPWVSLSVLRFPWDSSLESRIADCGGLGEGMIQSDVSVGGACTLSLPRSFFDEIRPCVGLAVMNHVSEP